MAEVHIPTAGVRSRNPRQGHRGGQRQWLPVVAYYLIACCLAWMMCLPLRFVGEISAPMVQVIGSLMMLTPAVAALVTVRFIEHRPVVVSLRLKPVNVRRALLYMVAAWAVMLGIVFLSTVT